MAESIETLKGRGPKDLESLSIELAAWMVQLAGVSPVARRRAGARARRARSSGAGLERFRRVIELQGGNPRVCDDLSLLPQAAETIEVRSERDGRVARLAARAIGHAGMLLGGGRETVDSPIDPAVGFVFHKKVGDPVAAGEPIVTVHVGKAVPARGGARLPAGGDRGGRRGARARTARPRSPQLGRLAATWNDSSRSSAWS